MRSTTVRRLLAAALAIAAGTLAWSCSRETGEEGPSRTDLSKLRVFYSTDAIGYLEPCG